MRTVENKFLIKGIYKQVGSIMVYLIYFEIAFILVKIDLQHGSLLLMNTPTNAYWYHSIPVRKSAPGVRINLTFRKLKIERQ